MPAKHIAVIGAGCSGLAAIKSCLDEGLQVTCFERDDEIGGLWNYSEESKPGQGCIYKSCVINTSKEMTAFSDFPIPENFPPFMPHTKVLDYLCMYANTFNLFEHIRFNTSVESVVPAEDYEETGRWEVTKRQEEDSESSMPTIEVFDGVMVCSGHHVYPHIPHFTGILDFKGTKLHSHEYRRPEVFEGKRVLIIGIGNSAVDIAVDLSRTASQVYLSTRRGAWIVSRMGPLGLPADALANSRFMFKFPRTWLQWMVEVMANFRFDHENFGVKARHRGLEAHPTINDDLPHRIMTGSVQVRPNVKRFGANTVVFDDGTIEEIDAIVYATGYDYLYRFLDKTILPIHENKVDLYKFVYPPHLKHPTLGVIGLVQAVGAVIPVSEMQTRWFTRVIQGKVNLPDTPTMEADIKSRRCHMGDTYVPSRRHHLQTFWIEYMDELAELIGALPSLSKLLLQDPMLAVRCFFGPCIPAQYRLFGPHPWKGAKYAIKGALQNNITPTKTRAVQNLWVRRKDEWCSVYYSMVVTFLLGLIILLAC